MTKFFTLVKKKGVETAIPPLEVLKAAAELIPVPALGPATEIILSIFEKVYQSQQNAGTAHEIANLCLRAHSTLSEHLQSVEITPALLNSIRQFEADLHDAQKTVQKYEQKMWIQHVFYSRSNNDDLQCLEKRVNNTLSLFQIKKLLSLEEICTKIYASVQRIEQNTVVLMNRSEPAPRSEGALVDIVPRNHFILCEEIINRPGYSLHTAEMRCGKIVAIKVFTGCKAKSTWEASNKFNLNIMHPNLPHLIGTSSSGEEGAPFSVYDLDIKDRVEGVILSWMNDDVDEIMYMCARMIHGISSALSNLSEEARLFDLDVEDIDILWDARGRVVLAIHPEVANSSTTLASPEDHTSRLLRMMDDICINVFRSVNRIRYDDEPDRTYTISSITQVDEDTSSLASSSQPSRTTVIQPRRELVWQAGAGRDTDLHKISQEYGSFVRRDRHFRQHVRRFHAQVGNPFLHHQCAAYQREDLTLTHAILDNKVVVYTVPSFGEVCVVCGTVSAGPPPPPPELIPPPEVPDSGSPPPVPSAGPPPPEPIPLPEVPPARPGWRTVNVRPSKKKKRDSGPPPPAAPPPGPYPRAQVREWAQWHPGSHFVPTPPTIDPYLLIPDQGGPGLFGPRSPRGSVIR